MKTITECRSCRHRRLTLINDLGHQYLSDFRDDDSKPPSYPLSLVRCDKCSLVQLQDSVDRELLYTNNYGFRSGVNETIRADLEDVVKTGLRWVPEARTWLDIASNDGTLLSFVPKNVYRVGVDPVEKFAEEARQHANRIVPSYFNHKRFWADERFEVITSISMFYDIENLRQFVAGVRNLMTQNGVWIIQQNYLLPMLQLGAIDNVCHEHLTYFSLGSLTHLLHRFDLDVLDVSVSDVNGGVIRTVVGNTFSSRLKPNREAINEQEDIERQYGLNEPGVFVQFRERVEKNLDDLSSLLWDIKEDGKSTYIYGASTRGAVLWQAAKVTNTLVDYAVERQPEKIGKYYSPLGIPIISEERMRRDQPDYLLVGPWWLRDSFVEREAEYLRNGGALIFPLPTLEVVRV